MLASKQAKAQRGSLGVAALQPAVREIFDISRFHDGARRVPVGPGGARPALAKGADGIRCRLTDP
jgi:hypothetical protein